MVKEVQYFPFGKTRKESGTKDAPYKFTGKEFSSSTGLYYYGARWYDPDLGRFISPDPAFSPDLAAQIKPVPGGGSADTLKQIDRLAQILNNPQRLNRYSYALNNPLRYVDNNGKWATEVHNLIIDIVFDRILPQNLRTVLKEASLYTDEFQSTKYSYMHNMSASGQPYEEAVKLRDQFINDNMHMYNELMKIGLIEEAYFLFGMAWHTKMDSTSPMHGDMLEWDNPWFSWYDDYRHIKGETTSVFNSDPMYLEMNRDLVWDLYSTANVELYSNSNGNYNSSYGSADYNSGGAGGSYPVDSGDSYSYDGEGYDLY